MSDEERAGSSGTAAASAAERTVRLTVPEMDCPSCAQKVHKRLERVAGITETALNPTTGTVTATIDPTRTTRGAIVDAIEQAGYGVVDRSEPSTAADRHDSREIAPPSEVWTNPRGIATWIGAALLTGGLVLEFLITGPNPVVATVLDAAFEAADLLFLGAITISGYPVVRAGVYSARARSLDIDLLMGTAILAATGIGFFVEAATLAVLFSIAELLEQYAMDRARDSLRELIELSPDEATVRRDGETVSVPAEDVEVGETVLIQPGEKVPLDGTVIDGGSAVDESPITGESVPVDKSAGDAVYAGSLNQAGYLEIQVTSPASDSTLARIIQLVEGAQTGQTETEQFVDRFAGYYTPVIVVLAVITALLPPLLITDPFAVDAAGYQFAFNGAWQTWFIRGLTLLVIACPCAFVISTPVSVVSGVTSAAKNGVLIKGGIHLEAMGEVETIALDKTGTLTKGELAVTDVYTLAADNERELVRIGASLEQRSEHPIAEAILEYAGRETDAELLEPAAFESLTGEGVRAELDGRTYYAGKRSLFNRLGIDLSELRYATDGGLQAATSDADDGAGVEDLLADLEQAGKTVVLIGTETELLGLIAIADEVRPTAQPTVERLHALGVGRIVMLTGDNQGTARAVAEEVGLDDYQAELLPEEKVSAISDLQATYGSVAMVGDGINDAPALATADVGIVMGAAGSDTALETADIALMADDLAKLPYLYTLSHRANTVIRENVWASLGVKFLLALGVPLGLVSVALAVVVGDMGMSLGVTGNAMRLSGVKAD